MNPFQKFVKRSFDVLVSFVGIIILLLPFVLLTAIIKLSSPGPVFYRQVRVGRRGVPFRVVKLRTMYVDANETNPITVSGDSRITPLGRFLRKYKLDELPQLWNVLIGKMSFVGPRPDVSEYTDKLEGEARKILDVRPGITGPASLSFRNEEELLAQVDDVKEYNDEVIWPAKVQLNCAYVDNYGFWKDIEYIIITVMPKMGRLLKPGHAKNGP